MVNHHTDPVAVDRGAASIYVLLAASMNRVDLGTIFNHHGYYFISPRLGTANGCEKKNLSQKLIGIAQPLSGLVKTTAWSVMMMTLMKWYLMQAD